MLFMVGDWLKDPAISACSPLARGVWMDLLCAMHENHRSGQITGTRDQLARLGRCTTRDLDHALADLQTSQAADVTERAGIVTVINRRMRREYNERNGSRLRKVKQRSKGASHQCHDPPSYSSSNQKENPPTPPDLQTVITWAEMLGCHRDQAERFWNHFESSGWIDKNGHAIVNARAKFTIWSADARARPAETAHHLSPLARPQPAISATADLILRQKELDRIEAAIKRLRDNPEDGDRRPAWIVQLKKLKARRVELLAILGLSV